MLRHASKQLHPRFFHATSRSSLRRPSWPFIRKTVHYSLIASGALAFSSVAVIGGLLLYDASTYSDGDFVTRPNVPALALHPERGGPKNLRIASALIDDADDPEQEALTRKPRLVIIGGGWGGAAILKHLNPGDYNVTVLSPNNYYLFTPLLPSACVGTVEIRSLVEGLRRLVSRVKGHVLSVYAVDIDVNARLIECQDPNGEGENFYVPYDKAIVAVGSVSNPHGVPGLENSFQLKTVQDVLAIRRKFLKNLEMAALPSTSEEERSRLLSIVVCGGGPTGVEFASEVADCLHEDVAQRFPKLLTADAKVSLIQSREHILNTYAEEISKYAEKRFQSEHIDTVLNARVKEITPTSVTYTVKDKSLGLSNEKNPPTEHTIPAGLVLWSTGIAMSPFTKAVARHLPNQYHYHALEVDSHLRVKGAPMGTLYAIGDASTVETNLQDHLYDLVMQVDKDSDGKVDMEEFELLVSKISRLFPMATRHIGKAREIFEKWDANNDRSLDLNELASNFEILSKKMVSYPPTAQVASQQGSYLGKKLSKVAEKQYKTSTDENSVSSLIDDDKITGPFKYRHLGSLAYIGNSAVFDFSGHTFTGGLIAMYLWRSVYWSEQVSFRTRFALMFDWVKRGLFGRDLSGFN